MGTRLRVGCYCALSLLLLAPMLIAGQSSAKRTPQSGVPEYVGVLEVVTQSERAMRLNPPAFSQVRYVFVRKDGKWASVPALSRDEFKVPESVAWHVIDGGKVVGALRTAGSAGCCGGPHAFAQLLDSSYSYAPNTLGNPGFYGYYGFSTNIRPLLVINRKESVKDPDQWVEVTLSVGEKKKVMAEIRRRYPLLDICDLNDGGSKTFVAYADSEVDILRAFRDVSKRVIVGLQFDQQARERSKCGDSESEQGLDDMWLLMRTDGTALDLGSRMFPVGAADLDGDGKSEWVFKISNGGRGDGYALFSDNFSKRTSALWGTD
jgi:hypothetical protein